MPKRTNSRSSATASAAIPRIAFDRRKYGRHLLIDVARIGDLRGFLVGTPHVLAFFDITLVTRGEGWLELDGHRHVVRPGTVLFTSPGQVRCWKTRRLDGICLFFEDYFATEFLQDESFLARLPYFHGDASRSALALKTAGSRGIRQRLDEMRTELAMYRHDSLDLLRAKLHEVLLVLAREYATAYGVAPQQPTHHVVSRFLELAERDAPRRRHLADYAAELAITPGHLSALCSRFTGQRAKRILENALVTRARRMLLFTDDSVGRIGASLGFQDPSYFSRFFRRETGQSPIELRTGGYSASGKFKTPTE